MAVAVKKYNPGFLSDDEIIASFCVRTAEFGSLVESLCESDAGSSPHSLVIGPRGSGKTHLLLRVAAEVRRNPALTGLFPITYAEESYEVTTCGEFWLECLGRLADQAPGQQRDNLRLTYDELRTVTDDQALADRCIGSLLDFADRHETRLLLLVENLNMLFDDINDPDVGWRLRQTLQTEPRFILFGSATSRFDEIDRPDHALYDLFRTVTLGPLSTAECQALWQSVAGKCSTTEAVRSLEILTGGNPRLLTVIARFGAERSFRDLMENLLDLVDEHTEYFKSHLESLPPQERRVYLALARIWKPATTREVADNARLSTSTCSSQLKRLVQRGVVAIEGGTPRRRQYYLTERLYNIFYLLRRGVGSDRLVQALVDFMLCLYSASDLVTLLDTLNLDLHESIGTNTDVSKQLFYGMLDQARLLGKNGRTEEAIVLCDDIIDQLEAGQGSMSDERIASALERKSLLLLESGQGRECIAVCDDILDRFEGRSDGHLALHVTYALGTKGMALDKIEDLPQAQRAFDQAMAYARNIKGPIPGFLIPSILLSKGMAFIRMNQPAEAIASFDQILLLNSLVESSELGRNLSLALILKAIALDRIGQAVSENEFRLLLDSLADEGSLVEGSTEAMIPFIAKTESAKALELLQESRAADLILPLIVALQQELGQTPQVAKEVAEVARDVRGRLTQARAKQGQARDQNH